MEKYTIYLETSFIELKVNVLAQKGTSDKTLENLAYEKIKKSGYIDIKQLRKDVTSVDIV